jgi:2-haloacid dehalogenase
VPDRWATFDCYGTLIDWDGGVSAALAGVFGPDVAPELVAGYHAAEPEVEAGPYRTYAEVMAESMAIAAAGAGLAVPPGEEEALARALPGWEPFPEAPAALGELRRRGWRLGLLSNCDRDLIAASARRLDVPFDAVVVAEDVRSYKPAHGHWERFLAQTGAAPDRHVHVAGSLFHDIAPARALGITCVWINRAGGDGEPVPDRELTDLRRLPDLLDALVPG